MHIPSVLSILTEKLLVLSTLITFIPSSYPEAVSSITTLSQRIQGMGEEECILFHFSLSVFLQWLNLSIKRFQSLQILSSF